MTQQLEGELTLTIFYLDCVRFLEEVRPYFLQDNKTEPETLALSFDGYTDDLSGKSAPA